MKRLLTTFVSIASGIATVQFIHIPVCLAQTATSNQNSTVGANSNFNQVLQNNPQVPINSVNTTNIRVPNVYPLQNLPNAYVNTENDFGMNLSLGVNTLDASNVTVYLGLIYQPGRSADHQARMARLRKETEVLEVQKKNMESNLTLLQKQIEEANLRLQKLQKTP
jgi:hypothetical protein